LSNDPLDGIDLHISLLLQLGIKAVRFVLIEAGRYAYESIRNSLNFTLGNEHFHAHSYVGVLELQVHVLPDALVLVWTIEA
jgi:hypothetical protein